MPFREDYEICKLLNCTPNDTKFTDLTKAQRLWFTLNIYKDKVDHAELVKNICMHIQPQAYFKKQVDAVNTDFISDILAKLGRELTPEEKLALNVPDEVDIDTITRD